MLQESQWNLNDVLIGFFYSKNEFNDVKHVLSLGFETGNGTQTKIKRLKGSKRTYLRHIIKTITRIKTL